MNLYVTLLLTFCTLSVTYADDNIDKKELLKRLLDVMGEKKEEKKEETPVVHKSKSILEQLEEELAKRKTETRAACPAGEERCGSSTECFESKHKCDGHVDCDNGWDETKTTCPDAKYINEEYNKYFSKCNDDQFACDNGKCYWATMVRCDGIDDCGDNSDEKNCPKKTRGASVKDELIRALIKRLLK